ALGPGTRRRCPDGCPENRPRDRCRLRLGSANRRHRRRALAAALPGARIREWLPDRQPGGEQDAAATGGRAPVVVSILFRDRTRRPWIPSIHAGLQQADLAARLAEMAV